jgi:multiple sugar transport system substrate-binding protein
MNKLILGLVILLALALAGVYFLAKYFFGGFGSSTIEYWGLWEPEAVYATVIADFQKLHPNVTVNYKKKSHLQYKDTLVAALKSQTPPDIFRFHNTWVPMLKGYMSPMPSSVYSVADFKATFYPVAQKDLFFGNSYYGIPLEIDTLALYVNEDIFNQAGLSYPSSWPQEFLDTARSLTVRNGGRIERAGAALGNAGNVTHWQDVVSLLLLQSGVDVNEPSGTKAKDAFDYYTAFQNQDFIWDETMDEAKLAFAKGNLAMFFGFSWDYFDIKVIAPALNFKIIPVPQLPDKTVNLASYWVEGVAKNSKNQKTAWEFLKFISSKEELTKLYTAQAKYRGFGEPYGRVDMANLLTADPVVGVFIKQAKTAQSSYLASLTWDGAGGINSRISSYYADVINTFKNSGYADPAFETLILGINQVLSGYGLVAPMPVK